MRVQVDNFLRADSILGASKKDPASAVIKGVKLILAEDLPFKSDADRFELTVELSDGGEYQWLANKTSLKAIIAEYGDETDEWEGKAIKLYAVTQNVSGEMKEVVYCFV